MVFALSSGGYIHNPDLSPANLGVGWHVKGAGDFDGNGKADIVWQHDNGRAAIWLIDGFALVSSTVLSPNPGVPRHVQGAGDYNGDGKSDIQWQNDSGQPMVWLMDGTTTLDSALVGSNPGPTWHLDWI